MSTHIIGFYEDWTKSIFQLSSNMHLISSSGTHFQQMLMFICNITKACSFCIVVKILFLTQKDISYIDSIGKIDNVVVEFINSTLHTFIKLQLQKIFRMLEEANIASWYLFLNSANSRTKISLNSNKYESMSV